MKATSRWRDCLKLDLYFLKCCGHPETSQNLLGWPQCTTILLGHRQMFDKSQRGYPWMEATTRWSDCLKSDLYFSKVVATLGHHKTYWGGQRTLQFFVAIGHNVWQVTKRLFMNGGHHKMVRLSQPDLYFSSVVATQRFRKTYWASHRTPQFL